MSPRLRVRSASVVLLGFLSIAFAVQTSGAQGLTEFPPGVINLMTPGASVTDAQGVIWSEGSGGEGGGSGVFAPFLREGRDSIESAFNTDYTPTPLDGKPGSFTHSVAIGSLATVTVSSTDYYSIRLDANETSGSESRLALNDFRIYSATSPAIPDYATLVSSGTLRYSMSALAQQFVLLDTANHPGGGTADMTVLIPKSYFSSTNPGDYLYLYNAFGDCACDSFHTSDGFEEWSALRTDHAPSVTAPLAINGEEGGTLSFDVTASDPDGDAISSLSADFSSLPAGTDASFTPNGDNTAGTFHWNMGLGEAGSYGVTFTATANDLSASATTHITVGRAGTNVTGVFTWATHAGDEGEYDIIFNATDEGGTTSLTTHISVLAPSGSPAPSAPLAPPAKKRMKSSSVQNVMATM